eukprot:gene3258-5961_t
MSLSTWMHIQSLSGLAIGSFSTLHIINNLCAIYSQDAYDSLMLVLREVYQNPAVEAAGIAAIGIHLLSGFKVSKGISHNMATRRILHKIAGYILAGSLILHVSHVRILPAIANSTADFAYVHSFIVRHPTIALPAYNLLLLAGITHTTYGISRVLANLNLVRLRPWLTDLIVLGTSLAGIAAVQGLADIVFMAAVNKPTKRKFYMLPYPV